MNEKKIKDGKEDDEENKKSKLNIATIGSKNRVCLPPETCTHLEVDQGDHLIFKLATTIIDKKPIAILIPVKAENFGIGKEETFDTIVEALK